MLQLKPISYLPADFDWKCRICPPILLAPSVKVPREKPWNLGLTRWFIQHFIPAVSLSSMMFTKKKCRWGIPRSGLISKSFRKPQTIWNHLKSSLAVVKSQKNPLDSCFLGCFIFGEIPYTYIYIYTHDFPWWLVGTSPSIHLFSRRTCWFTIHQVIPAKSRPVARSLLWKLVAAPPRWLGIFLWDVFSLG